MSQIDREIEQLEKDYNDGLLTLSEFNQSMRDLQRDYREAAEEAAQNAYDREMENWR